MSKKSARPKDKADRSKVSDNNLFTLLVNSAFDGKGDNYADYSEHIRAAEALLRQFDISSLVAHDVCLLDVAWRHSDRFDRHAIAKYKSTLAKMVVAAPSGEYSDHSVEADDLFTNIRSLGLWAGLYVGVVAGRKIGAMMECGVTR